MSKLHARFVPTPYWELGPQGRSRPVPLKGLLAGVALYKVEFLLDETPLSGTPLWARAPRLIAPAVAHCLMNLRGKDDRLILSVRSGPDYPRSVGRQEVVLRAEEAIYLDYVIPEKISTFWWLTHRFEGVHYSELLFEPSDNLLHSIVQTYWDWHSFRGYVMPSQALGKIQGWVASRNKGSWKARRAQELEHSWLFFEDWADACAIRLWTKHLTEDEVRSRLRLAEINERLARVSTDEKNE